MRVFVKNYCVSFCWPYNKLIVFGIATVIGASVYSDNCDPDSSRYVVC